MKILLVDNHDLIIDGLARLLKSNGVASETLKAHDGLSAISIAKEIDLDLIISDYRMPEMNGMELLITLNSEGIKTPILFVSMIDEAAIIETLINQGASGFINKEATTDEMVYGISQVLAGKQYLCRITQQILKKATPIEDDSFLTRRELQILKLVVQEKKNKQIAEELHINVSTVETHKKNLIKKLGLKSTLGLVKYALKHKLFE